MCTKNIVVLCFPCANVNMPHDVDDEKLNAVFARSRISGFRLVLFLIVWNCG